MAATDRVETVATDAAAEGLLAQGADALRTDRVGDAHKLYARALDEARNRHNRGEALEGIGQVAHRSGRPREAVQLLEQALGLLNGAVWERPALAEALGRSFAEVGELERATLLFEECRRRFQEAG